MTNLKNVKTIFFDYDGTLHDSIKIYAPAFRKAYSYLVKKGYADEREWTDKDISYWLGYNPSDMWKEFMPDISEEERAVASKIIAEEMKALIELGIPQLYEGAIDTLGFLKESGIRIVFISNCKIYYRDCHEKLFRLKEYFEELACSEEYGYIPKYEILEEIKHKYPEDMAIVGDRKQDIEAGKKNDIYTIGCSYGFGLKGEIDDADYIIGSINELKNLFGNR